MTMRRIYEVNDDYFAKIDTEDKAYFFGFMSADGYNSEEKGIISLSIYDLEILEKFQKYIESQRNPKSYPKPNDKQIHVLTVRSNKMSQDLAKLGCVQRKSLILKFPTAEQVPDSLIRHYIRGYNDGNGCIHIGKKVVSVKITSTKNWCESLSFIYDRLGIKNSIQYNACKTNNITSNITVGGNLAAEKCLEWLCEGANIYLQRKYKNYLSAKELIKNKQTRFVKCFGERKTIKEWSQDERCLVSHELLRKRHQKFKWTMEKSITTPKYEELELFNQLMSIYVNYF
jgi:hypothetical protein